MRTGNPGGGQGRLGISLGDTSLISLVLLFNIQALTIGKSPQIVKPWHPISADKKAPQISTSHGGIKNSYSLM
jgi:hypothetical protein